MDKPVKVNLSGMRRFQGQMRAGLEGRSGPMDTAFRRIGARYLAFARRRFKRQSEGGGDWPALAPATIRARRGGETARRVKKWSKAGKARTTTRGGAVRVLILRDTGVLLNALTIGMDGNRFERISGGVRVGFGGPARHPGGRATIADIAAFHNQGKGRVPKRQIIVEPDSTVDDAIKREFTTAFKAMERAR
jgi:hypothetical protein